MTMAHVVFKMGKVTPALTDMAMATFESYCQTVFQVAQAQGLTQKLDVDLFRDFALFMLKCFELNMERVVTSPYFGQSVHTFSAVLESVNQQDLNRQLIEYFTNCVNRLSSKYARQSQQVQ